MRINFSPLFEEEASMLQKMRLEDEKRDGENRYPDRHEYVDQEDNVGCMFDAFMLAVGAHGLKEHLVPMQQLPKFEKYKRKERER